MAPVCCKILYLDVCTFCSATTIVISILNFLPNTRNAYSVFVNCTPSQLHAIVSSKALHM